MKLFFCTLFDSNYLDKALVMYDSLVKKCKSFDLFVLAMDNRCYEVLTDLGYVNVDVIKYEDFEDDDLKKAKIERSQAELCWTCTAKLVKYIFAKYEIPFCTYIDADMQFYADPSELVLEMMNANCSVQLIEHNFRKFQKKHNEKYAGRFCVEFNTFVNNTYGLKAIESWEADCLQSCKFKEKDAVLGDQVYIQDWPKRFPFTNVSTNQGAGVAPWNVNKFIYKRDGDNIRIIDRESFNEYTLIFFHFQNLRFLDSDNVACCKVEKGREREVRELYEDYIKQIISKKKLLKEIYGIEVLIKTHPAEVSINRHGSDTKMERISAKMMRILNQSFDDMLFAIVNSIKTRNYHELIISTNDID